MSRDRSYRQSLGSLGVVLNKARVLLVGAGGIGCELLKNLVLSGFGEIHIVDLDTIDLSNLNRQFLFRHEHIKKPKAIIAKETASQFNPNVKIVAHHANIKDEQFGLEWLRQFNIVFNALDNLEARRHVNRMCLLANLPLIESGTTGFNGQVQTIKKGITECYDCNEKETPKTYPVCTIRSTPSQPIHCIVWAKSYLFTEIFGQSEDAAEELDNTEDAENAEEIQKLKDESKELCKIRESIASKDFARLVFEKIFSTDVKRLRDLEDMWTSRTPPDPLDFNELQAAAEKLESPANQEDQRAWDRVESFQVFCESIEKLRQRLAGAQTAPIPQHLSFDKDDEDMLNFVAAASNLRSGVFSIDRKSKFEVKQMAGNIIPAIATTNAMVAGLCVLEAYKVLRSQWKKAKLIFLENGPARALTAESLKPPNRACSVCSQVSASLAVDIGRATLKDLVHDVLKEKLGYAEGATVRHESTVLYDPDFDDNLSKTFADLQLDKNKLLTVVDEDPNSPRVDLSLILVEKSLPSEEAALSIVEIPDIPSKPSEAVAPPVETTENGISGKSEDDAASTSDLKRKREDEAGDENPEKKGKLSATPNETDKTNGHATVIVEDKEEGPIVLDD